MHKSMTAARPRASEGERKVAAKPRIDFFVIGAARCGTTSISRFIQSHENVYSSPVKEPRFFREKWAKGWDWYASIYANAKDDELRGDFSPSYSVSANNGVARRISRAYPNAKIIYCVRNPIDCALSNWRMQAQGTGEEIEFGEAMEAWRTAIVLRAEFFRQISYYREFYADDQIRVLPLENVEQDGPRDIAQWLGMKGAPAQYPWASSSDKRPDRPGIPYVEPEARQAFIDTVRDDTQAFLDWAGLPSSLWDLSPDYEGWNPTQNKIRRRMTQPAAG